MSRAMGFEQNHFSYDVPALSGSASLNGQCMDIDTSPSSFQNDFACIDAMPVMLYGASSTLPSSDPMDIDRNATTSPGGHGLWGELTVRPKAPQTRYAKPSEWKLHRELISTLYNQMTLPELMAFMEKEHNFRASNKMYKDRFRAWGINTKNKKPVTRKRRPKQPPRGAISKSYQTNADILQFDSVFLQHYVIGHPQAPGKSLFYSDYDFHQRILKAVRHFYIGSFENGNWIIRHGTVQARSRSKRRECVSQHNIFFNMCNFATDEFEYGDTREAERSLIIALAPLSNIAKGTDASFLMFLTYRLLSLSSGKFMWLARKILSQVVGIFTAVHGPTHPLVMLLFWMQQNESQFHFLEAIRQSIIDLIDEFAGPMDRFSLRMRVLHLASLQNRESCDAIGRIVRECESKLSLGDERAAIARRSYIRILYSVGDYESAIQQCHRGYAVTVAMNVAKAAFNRSWFCMELAHLHKNDIFKGLHYLEEALFLEHLCTSHTKIDVIRLYGQLELLYCRQGNMEATEKYRNERLTIINRAYDAALV